MSTRLESTNPRPLFKKIIPFLLIILVSIFVVFLWFRDGAPFGVGEEGLSFYFPWRTANLYAHLVYGGMGDVNPIYLPRIPFFWLSGLLNFVLPVWKTQAVTFLLLLVIGMSSVYVIVRKYLSASTYSSLSSGFFYGFNLYVFTQVWHRFIISGIVAWAYFPLFTLLFLLWFNSGKVLWMIFFAISSIVFSVTFGQPAFVFTFLTPPILIFFVEVYRSKRNYRNLIKPLIRAVSVGLVFLLVNIWWIYPYLVLGKSSVDALSNSNSNFESLFGVSHFFPVSQIMFLRQSFFLDPRVNTLAVWGNSFIQLWSYSINIAIFIFAVVGALKSRGKKMWSVLILIAFIGLFVSKGTNPPLGFIFFKYLFKLVPVFGSLRNSYEKFGLVFVLPYSIFFGLGLGTILDRIQYIYKKVIVFILLIIITCGVNVWPMWTGTIFPKYFKTNVPEYYHDVNEFLKLDQSDGRNLILPMIPDEGTRFAWGYVGVEPSEFLFDKSSISKTLFNSYNDGKYKEIYNAFATGKSYEELLDQTNVKFLILHDDLDTNFSSAPSPLVIKKEIISNTRVKFIKNIGAVSIYQYFGNRNDQLIVAEGDDTPEITYDKLSATHLKVKVRNSTGEFNLILKDVFNEMWVARVDGQKVDRHFEIYNYANGWVINKRGDFTIDIIYKVWPWQ